LEERIMLKDCRDANTVGWMRENRQSRDDLKRKVSTENGSEERIARALLGMAFAQTTGARDKPAEMEMCVNIGRDCRRKKSVGAAAQRGVASAGGVEFWEQKMFAKDYRDAKAVDWMLE